LRTLPSAEIRRAGQRDRGEHRQVPGECTVLLTVSGLVKFRRLAISDPFPRTARSACQPSRAGMLNMNHASATQLATTVPQKMVRNGCFVVLCRNTCRATRAPGQPPSRAMA